MTITETITNTMETFLEGAKELQKLIAGDIEKKLKVHSVVDFASLEIGIQDVIEKLAFAKKVQKDFNDLIENEKMKLEMKKRDLLESTKSRNEYQRRYKIEVLVLEKSLELSIKDDKKLERALKKYVDNMKNTLAFGASKRDKIREKFEGKIKECKDVTELYDVAVEIEKELRVVPAIKEKIKEAGDFTIKAAKKVGTFASDKELNNHLGFKKQKNTDNYFAFDSKLELLQPSMMGLFTKALQNVEESNIVLESEKLIGYLVIKYENYKIVFNKENLNDYYIICNKYPLYYEGKLLCTNKEADDFIYTISKIWSEI